MIPTTRATIRRLAGECRRRWSSSTAASLSTVAQGKFLQQGDPSDIICNNVSRAKAVEMFELAEWHKLNAYAPYSNFRVGAAVVTDSGRVYGGANVENASYGLTLCGERVAAASAAAGGERTIRAILVCTDLMVFKWCCGACTSTLLEFGEDVAVISTTADGRYETKGVRELAPFAFSKADLEQPRSQDTPIDE